MPFVLFLLILGLVVATCCLFSTLIDYLTSESTSLFFLLMSKRTKTFFKLAGTLAITGSILWLLNLIDHLWVNKLVQQIQNFQAVANNNAFWLFLAYIFIGIGLGFILYFDYKSLTNATRENNRKYNLGKVSWMEYIMVKRRLIWGLIQSSIIPFVVIGLVILISISDLNIKNLLNR